jgi:hypothetical protein
MKTLPTPNADGSCTNCGHGDFIFARELTEYSPCEFEDGKFTPKYADLQESGTEEAVRFYCEACGTCHQVPKELADG